jgi:hypothetical protein
VQVSGGEIRRLPIGERELRVIPKATITASTPCIASFSLDLTRDIRYVGVGANHVGLWQKRFDMGGPIEVVVVCGVLVLSLTARRTTL